MRRTLASTWRGSRSLVGGGSGALDDDPRYDQDDLRHLLATAGAMPWGITDYRPMGSSPRAGCASSAL